MNKKIIDHLNQKANTNYRHGTKKADSHINARVTEGATFDDFKTAIDNMVVSWRGTNMEQYLRPETLFGTKFWGYVNQKQTDVTQTDDRRDLLKAVLKAAGIRDISQADITIYDEVMKLIPTDQLPQLAVRIIRAGGEYKRPDTMISEAVKEFERGIISRNMRNGKRIGDFDRFIEFLQYAYRGKPICNGLSGLFKPFVTIGINRDGYFENQYTWKRLSSEDEASVLKWMFENQERIGVIERIDFKEEQIKIEHTEEQKEETAYEIISHDVNNKIKKLASSLTV